MNSTFARDSLLFLHFPCKSPSTQLPRSRITQPMSSSSSSSWSCSLCTFLNPPSQKLSCQICFSPISPSTTVSAASAGSGISNFFSGGAPTPGRWPCLACTYLNPHDSLLCEVCGTRAATFSDLLGENVDTDELAASDPSVGPVFLPFQRCGSKRPAAAAPAVADARPAEKLAKNEKEKHLELYDNVDPSSDQKVFKILSYNVWFREDLEVCKRMEALGGLIQQHLPDFICFQEVTPNIYKIFQSSEWWKKYRCSVSEDVAAERPYFCMQMSKLPVEAFNCKPFANSIMGRELCLADINLNSGKRLVIATSHLESPCPAPPLWDQMYSTERVVQAKESLILLKGWPNVIFAGDMNWNDKLDGAFPLTEGWVDAWLVKRAEESGWTYDTKSNKMLSGNRTLQRRLDRFLCILKDFRIDSIEMIGTEAIPGLSYYKEKKVRNQIQKLELPVLPSDHYGLLLTISTL